jgi:hypothetical protein
MALSRQQIAQIFASDADRYAQEKERALQQLGKTSPYAGLEKLTNIGVGAITGGLSGGLGGAVMGGISGSNADNPIQAGVGGMSMGSGLTDIIGTAADVPQIPGGISGAVQDTMGKPGDIGQLLRPENFDKTAELYKGMTGKQSGEDVLSKIGTINKAAITKQETKDATALKRQNELDDMATKQQNAIDLANVKAENKPTPTPKPKPTPKPTPKPKVDEVKQRKNYVSATNNIDNAMKKYADKPEVLAQYFTGVKKLADELWTKGELSNAQYNAIIKKMKTEE